MAVGRVGCNGGVHGFRQSRLISEIVNLSTSEPSIEPALMKHGSLVSCAHQCKTNRHALRFPFLERKTPINSPATSGSTILFPREHFFYSPLSLTNQLL